MENLARFIFGVLGNISALFLFLAPLITFKRILKKRSTQQFSGIPYLMTLLNCLLSAWYGLPFVSPNNLLLSTINAAGAAIESTYLFIFLVFAPNKEKNKMLLLLFSILAVLGIVVLVSLLAFHEGHQRRLFCGCVNTFVSIVMFASPLTVIRSVIKTKSVEFMPFSLSLCVFLCGTSWSVLGLLGTDYFIVIQNGFGCVSGIVQLVLHSVYYNKNKEDLMTSTTAAGYHDDHGAKVHESGFGQNKSAKVAADQDHRETKVKQTHNNHIVHNGRPDDHV